MEQHDELLKMFKDAEVPEINELLNLLEQSKRMPQLSVKSLGGALGAYQEAGNKLYLSPRGGSTNTVAHELTHALDSAMFQKQNVPMAERAMATGAAKQFYDGYDKLLPKNTKLPLTSNDPYRTSSRELRAFGVGNSVDKGNPNKVLGYQVNPHLDATMATEAAILRDLYSRTMANPELSSLDKIKQILNSK